MPLSPRAQRMLRTAQLHAYPRQREVIIALFEQAGLPVYEAIVQFQERFGGVEYFVRGSNEGLELGVISAGRDGTDIFPLKWNDVYFFVCGTPHVAVPCYHVMDKHGTMYLYCGEATQPEPIAESIEHFIESDAVLDAMLDEQARWRWIPTRLEEPWLETLVVDLAMTTIPEASDKYTTWWHNDSSRIRKFPDGRVWIWTKTEAQAACILNLLQDQLLNPHQRVYTWPFRVDEHSDRK